MDKFSGWLPSGLMRRGKRADEAEANASERYAQRFEGDDKSRKEAAAAATNEYYDLATDFYLFGWGQSFHFAPRYAKESFMESLTRHEHFLALKGEFQPGHKILDLGCGVGGPLRSIARFTHAKVIGVNNNAYQIQEASKYDKKLGLDHLTGYVKGDFCNMSVENNFADGAYCIEATCHAGDKFKCYSEVFRTLKPGACFVGFEWVKTKNYDPKNQTHKDIAHAIEVGDGLPPMETGEELVAALKKAGFEIEEEFDYIEMFENLPVKQLPWYEPLDGKFSITNPGQFRATAAGRWCTDWLVWSMEKVKLAPKGTFHTQEILQEAAKGLVAGGKTKTFTPAYFFKARKPRSA
jgi:sterol 24-C-methyltransferase